MSVFHDLLRRRSSNIKGSPTNLETLSTLVNGEDFGERVELPVTQTPPLDITSRPQHQQMQYQRQNRAEQRTSLSMKTDPIPRLTVQFSTDSEKMLAQPIPSVRTTDINRYREPGYMGINPITLMGETGLLPGSWGQGKEFLNMIRGLEQRKRSGGRKPVAYHNDTRMQHQTKLDQGNLDMNELRMQYAQAILDGGACVESSSKGSHLMMAIQGREETWAKECNKADDNLGGRGEVIEVEDDWVDVSEDEEDDGDIENASGYKRDDSGYSSRKPESESETSRAALLVVPRGKRVRFDEDTIDKEKKSLQVVEASMTGRS